MICACVHDFCLCVFTSICTCTYGRQEIVCIDWLATYSCCGLRMCLTTYCIQLLLTILNIKIKHIAKCCIAQEWCTHEILVHRKCINRERLEGKTLTNHWTFVKFAKFFRHQTFALYGISRPMVLQLR